VSAIPPNRVADPDAVLFYGLIALLTFAPLFQAGNRPLPLLVMELAALALLVWRCWSPPTGGPPLSHPVRIFLALLFLLPLAQLLPAPFGLWADLPGRSYYAEALRQTGEGTDLHWRAISLIPTATESAWLALLPPLAVFLVAIHLTSQQLLQLVLVFLGIATAEALLGLIPVVHGVAGAPATSAPIPGCAARARPVDHSSPFQDHVQGGLNERRRGRSSATEG